MVVDLAQIIPPLVRAKVDFILIGGMAAILHGSARVTFDVDLVYSRAHENIERRAGAAWPISTGCAAELAILVGRQDDQ